MFDEVVCLKMSNVNLNKLHPIRNIFANRFGQGGSPMERSGRNTLIRGYHV